MCDVGRACCFDEVIGATAAVSAAWRLAARTPNDIARLPAGSPLGY